MRRGLVLSIGFHVAVAALIAVGLPHVRRDLPLPEPSLRVELVPIAAITNPVPPQAEPDKPAPPEPPRPEPPRVEEAPPPKPEPPAVVATPPPPQKPPEVAALPKPEPEPAPKPEPRPVAVPPPAPVPRPEAKRQPPKDNSFDTLLKSLGRPEPKPAKPAETPREAAKKPDDDLITRVLKSPAPAQSARAAPLSMTVIDSIRRQVEDRWNIPAGAREVQNMQVEIRLLLAPDGSVRRAEVVDTGHMGDNFYRALAESAQRAVLMASPLKNLPPDQYDTWKDIVLGFRPPSG